MAYSDGRHNVKLSKALSWLLRHNMVNQGLIPSKEGFVDVQDVLRLPRFKGYTESDVEEVVRMNDKQRFTLRDHPATGHRQIRANQGHTIRDIDPDLKPLTTLSDCPERVVHGTYIKAWRCAGGINERGLSRMKRNHIHFAKGLLGEDGVISDGLAFFESANGVILCPGNSLGFLPRQYFKQAIHKEKKWKKEIDLLET